MIGDKEPGGALRLLAGFSTGSRIAGYRLEEQIGQGGTAVVFRAHDERLPRQVALKILSPALATDEAFRHRFIRESRSAAAVDDPHIIPVFEAGDANGVLFIAMRYVPSGDAGTLVRRLGPLPTVRTAAIISAVASALDAAHAAGLVHRDVKPANMLIDARAGRPDHVYLSDFGLTKGALPPTTLARTGHVLGTPTYCAPEQIQGQPVDARADEYALACAAFMLLSGEPPFVRDEGMAVLYAHLSEPPPRLTSRRQDLPAAVDDVLLRALAKAPKDRYLTCGEFADELRVAFGLQRYDSDVAVALHQRALADQQRRLGLDHADALASRASLAAARQEASRSDEAIALQQTLTDQRRALGPDHPDTLTTRFSIAEEMSARAEHTAAEGELRAVLAIRERMLGPEHPDTLATRFSIARQIAARGRHAAAETEFRAVLAARQRTLGRDHPDTLATRFSIAQEMAARGDHAGAEHGFRRVFAKRQRTLGPDHPDTLATWFSVAQEMAADGKHAAAEEEFWDVLAARQRTLGPDHPDTLATRFSIAQEMAARGDHAGAEEQFRHVLTVETRTLGPEHPDALIVRFSIAREMAALGNHARAEEEFRAVLPHLERRLGRDHPDTLATRFGIAQEMAALGNHAGALEQFRDVLAVQQRTPGAGAARLREAAWAHGLLRPDDIPDKDLAGTGVNLEEEAPPFDVDPSAVRLREAAHARGLSSGSAMKASGETASRGLNLRVHDRDALDEIELYAQVLSAVAAADRPLTATELDEALGIGEGPETIVPSRQEKSPSSSASWPRVTRQDRPSDLKEDLPRA